jgi:hypothetical protein
VDGGFFWRLNMLELCNQHPWLIVVTLSIMVPITGIVFGTMTHYWITVRQAELEATLKQDMLQRGMSADEIKIVIEASPRRATEAQRLDLQRRLCEPE